MILRGRSSDVGSEAGSSADAPGSTLALSLRDLVSWIHRDDQRGWFQRYCRYYLGRRMPEEDARQIKRWKAMKRHVSQVRKHCETGNSSCRSRQRQALLHWGYDSRTI